MKQGNALVNFVMIVMAIALACYMGIYVWNSFSDPFTTTYAHAQELAELATQLRDSGKVRAYEQIMDSVADYDMVNARLEAILNELMVEES